MFNNSVLHGHGSVSHGYVSHGSVSYCHSPLGYGSSGHGSIMHGYNLASISTPGLSRSFFKFLKDKKFKKFQLESVPPPT